MQNKRGIADHIDWILGIAMFLLAIGFTLTLFKPGIISVYNNNDLVDIVQNNFDNNIYWEINKVPIFVRPLSYNIQGNNAKLQNGFHPLIFGGTATVENGGISSVDNNNNPLKNLIINLVDENLQLFYVKYSDTDTSTITSNDENSGLSTLDTKEKKAKKKLKDLAQTTDREDNSGITKSSTDFILNVNINSNVQNINNPLGYNDHTKHILIYSNKIVNLNPTRLTSQGQACNLACQQSTSCTIPQDVNYLSNSQCQAAYEIGIPEKLRGISLADFDSLNTFTDNTCSGITGYKCLKKQWGFPDSKEFLITLEIGTDVNMFPKFPDSVSIPSNVNVFARRFNSVILTDDGLTVPVTVRIQVW